MKRWLATPGWRGGALAGALLLAVALAGPAQAVNTNLTATAQYAASSTWQEDQGNTTFVAAKAFDGDLTTRWNSYAGFAEGEWLEARWAEPVTINKVVVREAFDRFDGFLVQRFDTTANDWVDAAVVEDEAFAKAKGGDPANPTFTVRLANPIQTTGMRVVFTNVRSSSLSIFEIEAWNNPAGTVTGTVTDPTGAPIQDVTIRAGDDQAVTDAAGKYTLTTDAGTYNVVAGKPGFFRDRIARGVEIAANGTATQDFVLLPVPTNLSLAATAVSSSDWQGGTDYDAAKAKDGNLTTRWNSEAGDIFGAYLEMQWDQDQTFNKITIREAIGRITNYTLQRYDEANDAYVDILTADAPTTAGDRTYFHLLPAAVTSKRLRLVINDAIEVPTIWELEVQNAPTATARVTVKDAATGAAVPNATLTNDLGVILGTTNAQGQADLLVEPDDYVVTASAPGYFGGAPVAFTINAGEALEIGLTAPAQGANIALTATAVASTEIDDFTAAAAANDGDLDTYWQALDPTDQWIAVTWAEPTRFTVVQLRGFQGTIQRSFLQMLAEDGTTWVDIPNTTIAPEFLAIAGRPADFFFPQGITTRGVRYFITATNSATSTPGLAEFMVFNSPIPEQQ